jgi:hypothetical protein
MCAVCGAVVVAVVWWSLAESERRGKSWTRHSNLALLLKSTIFHISLNISRRSQAQGKVHVVDHATSVDPRCTLFSL